MNIGLDLGALCCRSLTVAGGALAARRFPTCCTILEGTAARQWLDLARIPYVECQNQLVVPVDKSAELVSALHPATYDVLPGGLVPATNPPARQLAALLIESLLPRTTEPESYCAIGRPALGAGGDDVVFEASYRFTAQLARLCGYQPLPLNPALALILAEAARENFTGLGLVVGATGCDLVIAHHGNQLAAERLHRGGEWLDAELAKALSLVHFNAEGARAWDLEKARQLKEQAWLAEGAGVQQQPLIALYQTLTAEIADAAATLLARCPTVAHLPKPLTLVYAGGAAQPVGFGILLEQALRSARGLIEPIEPRRAAASTFTVARGLLIRAQLESQYRTGDEACSRRAAA